MERVECIVIGAGVVGLAVARALSLKAHEVVVLEAEEAIGTQTSSRNSEVIHAGLYYATGSLKAHLCVEGKHKLYAYCTDHHIDVVRCGKLIVATQEEDLPALERLQEQGRINGVDDLIMLTADQARAMEPQLTCIAALHSPSTGIFDSHGFMLALEGDLEAQGGMIAFQSPVKAIDPDENGFVLSVGGETPMEIRSAIVINSAGLGAIPLAHQIADLDPVHIPEHHFAKGNYFTLSGRAPFDALIYPVPGKASLGLHYTRDLGGQGRFGPDVEWVDDINYTVDRKRADQFYQAIRRYWPALEDGDLQPGYAGVRPKIQKPGEPPHDFVIQGPGAHGVAGLVNLFGIESPGLTSSLAIADMVADMVNQ